MASLHRSFRGRLLVPTGRVQLQECYYIPTDEYNKRLKNMPPIDPVIDNRFMLRMSSLICSYWIRTNVYRFGDENMSFDFIETTVSQYYPGVISDKMVIQIMDHISENPDLMVLSIRHLTDNRLGRYIASYKTIREADKVLAVNCMQETKEGQSKSERIITVTNGQVMDAKFV